ncbi:hypothetical protein D3C80_1704220 [compost metagenome]
MLQSSTEGQGFTQVYHEQPVHKGAQKGPHPCDYQNMKFDPDSPDLEMGRLGWGEKFPCTTSAVGGADRLTVAVERCAALGL